jgi:toxin ParE1/3/4
MTVVWLMTALRQLARVLEELEAFAGQQSADNLQTKIDKKTQLLETQPKLYVEGYVKGTHELIVTPNVVLVYRIQPRIKVITIARVLKPRMQRPARRARKVTPK